LADDDTLARMATGEDADRIAAATTLARRDASGQTVVLLKGHRTVITDGQQYALNSTGNPGMATAGAGDVLTGLITALVCQGLKPFAAARLGAYLHGLAGDLAAERVGQVALVATDLIESLPAAFRQQE
jgi:NAD(P)H-hydrate epimerase